MTAATVVLTLLLNGQPFSTRPPAFLADGTVMVGFRDLAVRLGAIVEHDQATGSVTARKGSRVVQLSAGASEGFANATLVKFPVASAVLDGSLAVPLRFVAEAFGASIEYDNSAKTVNVVTAPEQSPTPARIGDIIAAPGAFVDRGVIVKGEYRGWRPSPFAPATKGGPPVSRSDWVLQDDTGEVYCTVEKEIQPPFPLLPAAGVGRRIIVTGRVALSAGAQPYLLAQTILPVEGVDGLVCTVEPDRAGYGPGETVRLTLRVENPFGQPLAIPGLGGIAVTFAIERGGVRVRELSATTDGQGGDRLLAGERRTVECQWDQSDERGRPAPWGLYRVTGTVGSQVVSYPCTIRLGG